jgi:hypothetical protein
MNTKFKSLLPADFAENSKVWIYQSSRLFNMQEALQIEEMLNDFTASWQTHGAAVKGFATLFFGRFIILMADETATGVSGCSTDSSVRLIKQIEQQFGVSLFDRQMLAFIIKDKLEILPMNQLNYAIENGFINADTVYFNNLVQTKNELLEKWMVPVKESWLAGSKFNFLKSVSPT